MKTLARYSSVFSFLLISAVALGFAFCPAFTHHDVKPAPTISHNPHVDVVVCDPDLEKFANGWRQEISRRFPDAVGILCHGGEFINGEWLVKVPSLNLPAMTADQVAQYFTDKFPGRVIVLLACNPGHLHLHVSGVYHAEDSVWCVPDRLTGGYPELDGLQLGRWSDNPGVVGSIFEFVQE